MGERDRLSRFDLEAGSIKGGEMNEQLAIIKRVAGTLIASRDNEIARLESENAELRAALEYIATGGEDWNDCARKARAILERTKK